jgi:uncharacterized protein YodC (DUF2158 family)
MEVMDMFQAGDVVQLKSGGPSMTIEREEEGGYHCKWFDGETLLSYCFRPEMLMKAKTSEDQDKMTANLNE